MARMGRPGLTVEQKAVVWERWRRGESLSHIGRELGKHPASVFEVLKASGGISPAARFRASGTLSPCEREEISRGIATGNSTRAIARCLGRAPSTVSREINRNGGRGHYRATTADQRAWD